MIERLSRRHVVLIGIGHTNAHVLRMWRMHALPDTDLTCVSDHSIATYSGMLPAVLAGLTPAAKMEIDLVRLCASVGASLITEPVRGIDHDRRQVLFADRPPVPFDVLSIGVGSIASTDGVSIDSESVVGIKPMQSFLARLEGAIARAAAHESHGPIRVVVVGSGVAGIEITFCLPRFVAAHTRRPLSLRLVSRSNVILSELLPKTRAMVLDQLANRGVDVVAGQAVKQVSGNSVMLADGAVIEADVVVWATGAAPPALLADLDLPRDSRGFLAIDSSLQSTSRAGVFAVGDTGTIVGQPTPKAGVYAVRQGPVLWENIRRSLDGLPLRDYRPQESFLKLMNLGDGRAIGQWKRLAFQGRWVMRLKDLIDTRFMDKFRAEPMQPSSPVGAIETSGPMQCRGCGCKVGSDVLMSAIPTRTQSLDDAAEIGEPDSGWIASTDFFSSPVPDPYFAGRIAALHAASDIIASGGRVRQALANVVVPEGDRADQRRVLRDFLAGARRELDAMDASIVGGHTIAGPRMEIGFTVIGQALGSFLIRKCHLRPGQHLYLTKPLGIGVLLAAHMRSACPARDFESLCSAMLQRQHQIASIAVDLGIDAGTDVTGFGLAGHLMEMLRASRVSAQIELDAVPTLPGATALIDAGIESTLAPDNRAAETSIDAGDAIRQSSRYKILFDPQTCGGLLLGVTEEQRDTFLTRITGIGLPQPACIGRVTDATSEALLRVR